MKITALKIIADVTHFPKLNEVYVQFNELINELNNKNLPDNTIRTVNSEIEELNSLSKTGNSLKRILLNKQTKIVRMIEKEHKIVPKNYYRKIWLAIGMVSFGLPIGVAWGAIAGNMGLLAIGLPVGMAIGLAVGSGMDKKALNEGRQLNVELKS